MVSDYTRIDIQAYTIRVRSKDMWYRKAANVTPLISGARQGPQLHERNVAGENFFVSLVRLPLRCAVIHYVDRHLF